MKPMLNQWSRNEVHKVPWQQIYLREVPKVLVFWRMLAHIISEGAVPI
jgi:hypothetical protein